MWLNAETELRYPVQFNGKERVVYLKGEAYFEVSKNKEKPFLVQVDDMSVKVYGTEFNVNTYNNIETVLVTGSVSMNQGGKEVLLKPNQKGVFDKCRVKSRWRMWMYWRTCRGKTGISFSGMNL